MPKYISAVDLSRQIAAHHRITIIEARQVIDLIFRTIGQGMAEGKETWIPNFGKFYTVRKSAGMVRNPREN